MIVIFRNEGGTLSVRPAWIGFIKNNIIRRTLCSLAYPFVLLCAIVLNLLQATLVSLALFFRAVWVPLREAKLIWKTETWRRPRTKADAHKTMG